MNAPDPTHLRGRETSNALTEVRTVLSRAEHARGRIDGRSESSDPEQYWLRDAEDPDAAEMRAALDAVIGLLDKWRRTGRPAR